MLNPRLLLVMIAGLALAVPVLSGGSALAATGEGWGTAAEAPGTAALNAGNIAQMTSMSCPSSGNCAAGGTYIDSTGNNQPFVADEASAVWGQAIELPGTSALGSGVNDEVDSLSCAPGATGDCALGGQYLASNHWQAFVADEASGVWEQAIGVPGAAALNVGGDFSVVQVSCPAPGRCTVGGSYDDVNGWEHPFVARQTSGVWGQAKPFTVPLDPFCLYRARHAVLHVGGELLGSRDREITSDFVGG